MKDKDEKEIIGIMASNRKVFIDYINSLVNSSFFNGEGKIYLAVGIKNEGNPDCEILEYPTEADVPEHSVHCPCGNPKHWIIKYMDEFS